jgi:hypothetical protein
MAGDSSSGPNGSKPPNVRPNVTHGATPEPRAPGVEAQAAVRTSDTRQNKQIVANTSDPTATVSPQATIPCPKCGAAVREVARFCQRCHMTMRFECPSCGNKQRTGVKCEKCGINFVKYIGAVGAPTQAEEDTIEAKMDRRSALLKNVLAIPLTGGLSLFKQLFRASNRKS